MQISRLNPPHYPPTSIPDVFLLYMPSSPQHSAFRAPFKESEHILPYKILDTDNTGKWREIGSRA